MNPNPRSSIPSASAHPFDDDNTPDQVRSDRNFRLDHLDALPDALDDADTLRRPNETLASKGIFSENGHAEVWLSDDDKHIMLQLKSKLSFGSLNLYLKSYFPSPNQ